MNNIEKEKLNKIITKRHCSKISKDLEVKLKNTSNSNEVSDTDVTIWNVQVYIK